MIDPKRFASIAVFSLLALFAIATIVREAVDRLKAGPIRFRLPLASVAPPAKPPRGSAKSWILMVVAALLMIPAAMISADPSDLAPPLLFLWVVVHSLQSSNPGRDARRRLVLASGLIALGLGALLLAVGLRASPSGDHSAFGLPRALVLVYAVILLVIGTAPIQESFAGTRVRERAIQAFGETYPWSRIIVKDWSPSPPPSARRCKPSSPHTPRPPGDRGSARMRMDPPKSPRSVTGPSDEPANEC
jgi:hypothetical protein